MHYSPVRRSSAGCKHPLLPLDLHVLSLPPAFNLSHDQTLQFKVSTEINSNLNLAQDKTTNISYTWYIGKFLLVYSVSPLNLSKHPHELLNAEFLKNVALIYRKVSLKAGCVFYRSKPLCQSLFSKFFEEANKTHSSILTLTKSLKASWLVRRILQKNLAESSI